MLVPTSVESDSSPVAGESNGRGRGRTQKEITKQTIRLQTWRRLNRSNILLFPRPCTFRIPRFKGEIEALRKLSEMDEFKQANVIKVNLDKAQESVRQEVLRSKKELMAGTAGLRGAAFLTLKGGLEVKTRAAATRAGISQLSSELQKGTKADLIVVGSVAVDLQGRRIGKGGGFSDLEYALLDRIGGVKEGAAIVTLVHDMQVYDSLPNEIFEPYDVPVDYIITPSKVYRVTPQLQKPSLQWELLSARKINSIPLMKELLEGDREKGVEVVIKCDSEVEEDERRIGRGAVSGGGGERGGSSRRGGRWRGRGGRFGRIGGGGVGGGGVGGGPRRRRRPQQMPPPLDSSSTAPPHPSITSTPRPTPSVEGCSRGTHSPPMLPPPQPSSAQECLAAAVGNLEASIIATLQGLRVRPEGKSVPALLTFELAKPIGRINAVA